MRGPASSISMLLLLHALCCNHLIFKSSPPLTHSHSCPSPPDLFHPLCHERKRRIRSPEQEERNTFCSTNIYKHIILADFACRRERMFHLLLYKMFHYTRLLSLLILIVKQTTTTRGEVTNPDRRRLLMQRCTSFANTCLKGIPA